MLDLHSFVSRMLDDSKGVISPKWEVRMVACARIIQSEERRQSYIDSWELEQSLKNR